MSEHDMHLLDPAPFGRILPAMVTPMKSDGSVDFDAAQKLAKQLVADGADGLVVNGTTGESPVTHMDEKVNLVKAVEKQQRTGLAWYSGDDGLFLPFLSIGAVGIISVIAHVASNPMQQLVQAFDRGDITTARRLANQLAPLVHALNGDGYQAVMAKAALKVRGVIPSTTMRLPNIGPDAAQLDKAEEGMRAAGLL